MSIRNKLVAFAATLLLLVGGRSEAAYTYSSAPSSNSIAFGAHSTLALAGVAPATTFSGDLGITTENLGLTTTATPSATDTGTFSFTDSITISPTTGGTLILTVIDTIQFIRSDTGGSFSTATITGGTLTGTAGGFTYTVVGIQYQGPNPNTTPGSAGAGGITTLLQETLNTPTVPEPASFAMVVIGLGGVFAVRRYRRRAV